MEPSLNFPEKAKLKEVNQYLTCYLCKGYLVDATTISECLHSFCRSCIIKFLEENSHCPVCELIINKAKPNLKLDKTLQDIVYKLVPDLFLREMTRRKLFYQHYPQLALRVSPEERGEDTERTIFNAQEKISLSLEYICDDSSPGAIRLSALVKSEKSDNTLGENDDCHMKRFLLCPGMCRIDVLKKFVRNKYSVDTNEFYIDILYKRVPLPDHYTLIDVAYIYSWQRNETMKFFFRITDINKASSRFDFFDASPAIPQVLPKSLVRTKSNVERNTSTKRKESVSNRKSVSKLSSRSSVSPDRVKTKVCDEISSESCSKSAKSDEISGKITSDVSPNSDDSNTNEISLKSEKSLSVPDVENNNKENNCSNVKSSDKNDSRVSDEAVPVENKVIIKKEILSDQNEASEVDNQLVANSETPKQESKVPIENKTHKIKSEPKSPVKSKNGSPRCKSESPKSKTSSPKRKKESPKLKLKIIVQEPQSVIEDPYNFDTNEFFEQQSTIESSNNIICKPNCYTKITLNRTNNVEIITKVHTIPYSSKNNEPTNQTVQPKQSNQDKSTLNNAKPLVKKVTKIKKSPKNSPTKRKATKLKNPKVPKIILSKSMSNGKKDFKISPLNAENRKVEESTEQIEEEDEQTKFLRCFNLQAKPKVNNVSKMEVNDSSDAEKPIVGQKRKNSTPVKTHKAKIAKLDSENVLDKNSDEKKVVKPVKIILQQRPKSLELEKQDNGLQSLINNCKIPSSLSITIKESSEPTIKTPVAPPVKNFIEILKISDDGTKKSETQTMDKTKVLDDSENQVDQDLNEIAKSLTEKIPMSTTISHIIGPKQSFSIPIKNTLPKMSIQPAPVPELSNASNDNTKKAENGKGLNSFQKIFEESIKNADGSTTNITTKRNLLKNSVQVVKKAKNEEKLNNASPVKKEEPPLPKVAIPRLPHQRNLKLPVNIAPRTVASLHSSSLGMNYTVSVGQTSPTKTNKVNGTISPEKMDSSEFKVPETSKDSPKKSPRSSPVVKHMFGASSQKLVNISPKPSLSPRIPEPNTTMAMNPNELIEKYNLQNLAQLTATLNFNPAVLALPQTNQIAAFQQAMLLKQFEMQNRQNWLVRNQGPLLQYENYLKSLSGVKEN